MVNGRKKGNRSELEVIKILRKHFDGTFERRSMGMEGADVIASGGTFRYSVEIKNHKTVKALHLLLGHNKMLFDWWKQARQQALAEGKEALLVVKAERHWFCTEMEPSLCNWVKFENWCEHQT